MRYSLSTKGFSHRRWHEPSRSAQLVTPLETRLLASIFGTLLSSQGSDAHRVPVQRTRRRGNPSNLPACFVSVKSVTRLTRWSFGGRIRARMALGGRTTLPGFRTGSDRPWTPPGCGSDGPTSEARGGHQRPGPACFGGDATASTPVVSVPPWRADSQTVDAGPWRTQIADIRACPCSPKVTTAMLAELFPAG